MKKIVLAFVSPNTTTKGVTEELKKVLTLEGHEVITLNIGEKDNREFETIDFRLFEGVDLIGIGCPVYHLTLVEPMERFLQFALPRISKMSPGIQAFIYFTYSGITTGRAFSNAASFLKNNHIALVGAAKIKAPHFLEVDGYPNESAKDVIRLFCSRLSEKDFRPMAWDKADEIFQKRKSIINMIYPLAKTIGRLRKQTISISSDLCIECRKCADQCPVHAITMNGSAIRDPKKCMYCYHCAVICPKGAIQCNVAQVYKMIRLNKKIVGTENPENDIFV